MDDAQAGEQHSCVFTATISDHLYLPLTSELILLVVPSDELKPNTESERNEAKKTFFPIDADPIIEHLSHYDSDLTRAVETSFVLLEIPLINAVQVEHRPMHLRQETFELCPRDSYTT